MNRPKELSEDVIPMVPAVALSKYQEILKYAVHLEEKIIKFEEAWSKNKPYATKQDDVDDYREAMDELIALGKSLKHNVGEGEDMKCLRCGSELVKDHYCGGDHDPTHFCPNCGIHVGCGTCNTRNRSCLCAKTKPNL